MSGSIRRTRDERGFALILALLTLVLLTFLGLTLAVNTTMELQIATNFRWGYQAQYNAEAALEVGKALLRSQTDWTAVAPAPRGAAWVLTCTGGYTTNANCTLTTAQDPTFPTGTDAQGQALRHGDSADCDVRGSHMGFGQVLAIGGTSYQNRTTVYGQPVAGAFTIWVRRPAVTTDAAGDASTTDSYVDDDWSSAAPTIVLTAEGTAPYTDIYTASNLARTNRAVKVIEAVVSQADNEARRCEGFGGQAGGAREGSGYGGCVPITSAGVAAGINAAGGSASVVGMGSGVK